MAFSNEKAIMDLVEINGTWMILSSRINESFDLSSFFVVELDNG